MSRRLSDPVAKILATVVAFAVMFVAYAILGGTKGLWGIVPMHAVVWAPLLLGGVTGSVVYSRKTRLLRCPSGCGQRVDISAGRCTRCGCALAATSAVST